MAKKRGTRRQKRMERKAIRQQQEQYRRRLAERRKWMLVAIAIATVGGALAIRQAGLPNTLLGMLLLIGCGLWLIVALGGLSSRVKPRDRGKAGNIDYGS